MYCFVFFFFEPLIIPSVATVQHILAVPRFLLAQWLGISKINVPVPPVHILKGFVIVTSWILSNACLFLSLFCYFFLEFRHSQLSMTVPHYSPSPEITAEPSALVERLPPKQSSNNIFRIRHAQPKINEEDLQRLCLRAGGGLLKPKPPICSVPVGGLIKSTVNATTRSPWCLWGSEQGPLYILWFSL